MEDNGDAYRVIYGNGIYRLQENQQHEFNGYFVRQYGLMQYYNEYPVVMFTVQNPFIRLAVILDKAFTTDDHIFDIRFLGFLVALYFAITMYFLVDSLTYQFSPVSAGVVAMFCVYVFADTGYTAYFNSFFAEGIAQASFLACMTCALLYSQQRYNKYVMLSGYIVNSLLLTFTKQQFAPLGVLLGLLGFFFLIKENTKLFRWIVSIASAGLMLAGILMYVLIPNEYVRVNQYHAMTRGILMTSDNPEEALEFFDIDPQFALLNETIYFERYPVVDVAGDVLEENFYTHYGFVPILQYYIAHPGSFLEMMDTATKMAYHIRPELGNYEHSVGYAPKTKAMTFSLHSTIKAKHAPKTIGFMILWTLVAVGVYYRDRLKQIIIFAAILVGVSQFFVSVIGAGDADLLKHIFLYNVVFDYINLILLASIAHYFDKKYKTHRVQRVAKSTDDMKEVVEHA